MRVHKAYHDSTIQFTVANYEWINGKNYQTDGDLADNEEEQAKVWRASKERLHAWPKLDPKHIHHVSFGSGEGPQRFSGGDEHEALLLGDPGDNIFIINLPRRPAKLRNALCQLHSAGLGAHIVDAVDGDVVTSQEEVAQLGASTLPGYCGHKNTLPHLTTGQLGCFMSHFAVWQHMVDRGIPSAIILEDDFDLQPDFAQRLGEALQEARGQDWNLMYLGRSPTEPDIRRVSPHLTEPSYTLWTVGYVLKLDAAKAFVEGGVQRRLAPLDHYFSVAMGKGLDGNWNEHAVEWSQHIPQVLNGLAITPPLVMPYVGSMFLSDTAMLRKGTKFVADLPDTEQAAAAGARELERAHEKVWRASKERDGRGPPDV